MAEKQTSQGTSNGTDVSSAVPSIGTALKYKKDGEDDTKFVEVANFTDISSFTGSANFIDVTRLNGKGREKKRGMPDWGQVTIALHVNMTEPSHKDLFNARKDGTLLNFRLILPDERNDKSKVDRTEIDFSAYVKDFPISAKIDQMLSSSVNLEVTGDIEIKFRTSA